jgi:hypothetical protein
MVEASPPRKKEKAQQTGGKKTTHWAEISIDAEEEQEEEEASAAEDGSAWAQKKQTKNSLEKKVRMFEEPTKDDDETTTNKTSTTTTSSKKAARFYEASYRNIMMAGNKGKTTGPIGGSSRDDDDEDDDVPPFSNDAEEKVERGLHHGVSVYHVGHKSFTPERKQKMTKLQEKPAYIILPWSMSYKCWWGFLVFCAIFTMLLETYEIAFEPAGLRTTPVSTILHILSVIFLVDVLINFHLAFEEHDAVVHDRRRIAYRYYYHGKFVIDILSVLPFYPVAIALSGNVGQDTTVAQYLGLLRLLALLRLHRVVSMFADLQYNMGLSLMWLTLLRNFMVAFLWSHFFACAMYFTSRQYDFDADTTWIGGSKDGLSPAELYILAMYW